MNGLGKIATKENASPSSGSKSTSIFEALRTTRGTSIFAMLKAAQGGSIFEELRVMKQNLADDGQASSLLQKDWKRDP
jgi:hypothetical protein